MLPILPRLHMALSTAQPLPLLNLVSRAVEVELGVDGDFRIGYSQINLQRSDFFHRNPMNLRGFRCR